MDRVEITKTMVIDQPGSRLFGICAMQVCATTDTTDEEVLTLCNQENPSGTTMGWAHVVREDEEHNQGGVACLSHDDRVHLIVVC